MIKMGTTTVKPAGVSKVYVGDRIVYYSIPPAYRKLTGIVFDAKTYYRFDDFHLRGDDTVRMSLSVNKACNVFGCYTSGSAQDNYSLYVSTATSAKYMRYDGGTYKSSWASEDMGQRFDIVISPIGTSGMPAGQDDTWEGKNFVSTPELCIGTTSVSTSSSKFDGTIYGGFVVDGRLLVIPVERISDGVIGYYDAYTDRFYEPIGDNPTPLGYA